MCTKYKLIYFPNMGLAEPIRFLLSYAGEEFEDFRFQREDWPQLKDSMPFGKVPILEIDGKRIHQSVSICRYLAKQFKLTGSNDWEALQCDIMVDTMSDLRTHLNKYYHEKDDKIKEELKNQLLKETMPYYLNRFDAEIKKNSGYFVGGKLTWADLYIVAILDLMQTCLKIFYLDDETYPNLKTLKNNVMNLPNIKAWVEKRPKTEI